MKGEMLTIVSFPTICGLAYFFRAYPVPTTFIAGFVLLAVMSLCAQYHSLLSRLGNVAEKYYSGLKSRRAIDVAQFIQSASRIDVTALQAGVFVGVIIMAIGNIGLFMIYGLIVSLFVASHLIGDLDKVAREIAEFRGDEDLDFFQEIRRVLTSRDKP